MHAILVTLLAASSTAQPAVKSNDWPHFRGPSGDAISTETGLLKSWPNKGPKLLWNTKDVNAKPSVGSGLSSMTIVDGRLFTMGDFLQPKAAEPKAAEPKAKDPKGKEAKPKVTGDEFVLCYEADTGKEIWRTKIGPVFRHGNGDGPRCTPTIDAGKVYVLSPQGLLVCLTAAEGSILWQKDLPKEFGGRMMTGWGYSESPFVDGDKVIVTPGGKKAAMVALDKATGSTIWTCEIPKDSGAGYGTITKTTVGGIPMYVTLLGKEPGLIGVHAKTGKFLWNNSKVTNGTANCPTAIAKDDYVFYATGYNAGACLLKLIPEGKDSVKAEEQYVLNGKQLQNHHGGMIMLGDYIYGGHGNNGGQPFCLEWKTGKLKWGPETSPGGRDGRSAAVLYADDNLYFRYEGGMVALIEATPEKMNVKGSFELNIAPHNWAHPVIWHGKLFIRGEDQIRCYDVKAN